jgi:hypothetical protein
MDEFTADAFFNGDELPSKDIDYTQCSVSHNAGERSQLSAASGSQDVEDASSVRQGGLDASSSAGLSLQDRLFAKYLIPMTLAHPRPRTKVANPRLLDCCSK